MIIHQFLRDLNTPTHGHGIFEARILGIQIIQFRRTVDAVPAEWRSVVSGFVHVGLATQRPVFDTVRHIEIDPRPQEDTGIAFGLPEGRVSIRDGASLGGDRPEP